MVGCPSFSPFIANPWLNEPLEVPEEPFRVCVHPQSKSKKIKSLSENERADKSAGCVPWSTRRTTRKSAACPVNFWAGAKRFIRGGRI